MTETAEPTAIPPSDPALTPRVRNVTLAQDLITLTKPKIISLLLVTTIAPMFVAGSPSWMSVLWVTIGGYLMAGGANAVNMYLDSDIDDVMVRTKLRPIPSGRMSPRAVIAFGVLIATAATYGLAQLVNVLTATLALAGFYFYVFIYTRWLKRSSPHNIVIGGAAGAFPPLVGWAAVTGELAAPAWVLFALVFFWTPPHFWALALRYVEDYRNAGFPMLPVTKGVPRATREIFAYSVVVLAISLVLPAVSDAGALYVAMAAAFGLAFVWHTAALARDPSPERAIVTFTFSNTYLAVVFAAVAVDTILRSL